MWDASKLFPFLFVVSDYIWSSYRLIQSFVVVLVFFFFFSFSDQILNLFLYVYAEYRTVSGVAGPLVILDKVKVNIVLFSSFTLISTHAYIY